MQKLLLPENGKNLLYEWIQKIPRKKHLQHGKLFYWNHAEFGIFIKNIAFQKLKIWLFICRVFTFLGVVVLQVKNMTCLWGDTIILTENSHAIMQKDVRYSVKKFTHNTSLVVSTFLCREFRFSTLTNWNHPPYLWQNFIIIYPMKVIRMLALLRHIFVLFFNFFLQKKW